MKHIFQVVTAIGLIAPTAMLPGSEPAPGLRSVSQTRGESPLACNALALSPETRKRHFEKIGPALLKLKKSARELADGYELEFPANRSAYQVLTEWAFDERLCCPFLEIGLRFDREGGPLWLRLTGRPGTKEFIKSELASAIQ